MNCLPLAALNPEMTAATARPWNRCSAKGYHSLHEEGLHDQRALVGDLAQRAENLRARHPAASRRTPVRFAEMEMAQPGSRLNDGASDAVFLDVQVKGVQMDFAIGAAYPLCRFLVPNPIWCPNRNWNNSRRRMQTLGDKKWNPLRCYVVTPLFSSNLGQKLLMFSRRYT